MRIGLYEIESSIGQGAAGVVYKARGPDGALVAIKVLKRRDEDALRRFEREGRLQSRLGREEGFVPVLETGLVQGAPYLVLPFLGGGTLRDRLARGPLGVAETVALGASLARTLGRAHALGVVHRDVKPENILFAHEGAPPLLADLGLAKHFDPGAPGASASAALSATGSFRGTAAYMAPEQAAGSKELAAPADVFALGAVLYECLVGQPAFAGESLLEVLSRISDGAFVPIARFRRDVPRALANTIERALAKEPRARFSDGLALARALEAPPARSALVEAGLPGLLLLAALGVAGAVALGGMRRSGEGRPLAGEGAAVTSAAAAKVRAALSREAYEAFLRMESERTAVSARKLIALDPGDAGAHAMLALALRQKDPDGARAAVARALALDPRCAAALAVRSRLAMDPESARACAEEAIAADERSPFGWLARGIQHMLAGENEEAVADETRALELEPRLASASIVRGGCLVRLDRPKEAIAEASRAIDLAPSVAEAWMVRADARNRSGDQAGAVEDATHALERDPLSPTALGVRGAARYVLGEDASAVADLSRSITIDEESAFAWMFRAAARERLGQHLHALADATRAVELSPRDGDVLAVRGTVHVALHAPRAARADFTSAIECTPSSPRAADARRWLATHPASDDPPEPAELPPYAELVQAAKSASTRDARRAIALLSSTIPMAPTRSEGWQVRSTVRLLSGDRAGAIDDAAEATDLAPGSVAAWLARGLADLQVRDVPAALEHATLALALAPRLADAWQMRASARRLAGDQEGAIADACAATLWNPTSVEALAVLGGAFEEHGRRDMARAACERLLALQPDGPLAPSTRDWLASHPP